MLINNACIIFVVRSFLFLGVTLIIAFAHKGRAIRYISPLPHGKVEDAASIPNTFFYFQFTAKQHFEKKFKKSSKKFW